MIGLPLVLLLTVDALGYEVLYSVSRVQCELANTRECVEACDSANCRHLSFLNLAEAKACVPPHCIVPVTALQYWAFPSCADEEKGIYAIQLSRDNSNILEALQQAEHRMAVSNEEIDMWVSVITTELEGSVPDWTFLVKDASTSAQPPQELQAMIALSDQLIVADKSSCELPELTEQLHMTMTRQAGTQLRANTQTFSLKPLIDVGLTSLLRKRRAVTVLIQPDLTRFVGLQKVGPDMGLGAVEIMF